MAPSFFSRTWLTIVQAAIVLAPLVVLAVTRQIGQSALESDVRPAALIVQASLFEDRGEIAVRVEVIFEETQFVFSPGFVDRNVVTHVDVAPESKLVHGDTAMRIDGIAVLAIATDAPFHRGLALGDSGSDVEALQTVLVEMGLLASTQLGHFDRSTQAAVKALEEAMGRATPKGVFSVDYFVWLPAGSLTIDTVHVSPGQPAPSFGEALFSATPRPESLRITSVDGRELSLESVDYILTVEGQETRLNDGLPRSDSLGSIAASLRTGETTVDALLRPATQRVAVLVPASALIPSPDQEFCIWTPLGSDPESYAPQAVRVIGSAPAGVLVEGQINAGDSVLANPGSVLADPSCR